ncbi:MAG TPA: glycosyltransferase family 2 protein [Gemmataceae bacterium]|nr:glycosyltransferase family 2 protein [Gemmataceae bacterium]
MTALSIVIPSHDRMDLLRLCLASVTRYAPAGAEVLVVDDASPAEAVSAVAAEFGVRSLRQLRRGGFCAAVNAGLRAAAGAVVELLNDDTEVTAGWAEAALAHFADESVAAVAPLVLYWPDGERVDSAGDRYYLGGVATKRGHGERLSDEYLQPRAVFGASGSSAFYRRKALLQVGDFPETFGAYFEDVDVAFRLQRAGYRAVYEPAARVLHRVSASYGSRPRRRLVEQQSCNEERVFWRNIPGRALARALPRHLAVLAAKAWRRWREGTLAPFLCGRLRLLAEVPALLRHRRQLRALGTADDVADWQVEERYWGPPRITSMAPSRRGSASS